MIFEVIIQPRAHAEIRAAYLWLSARSSRHAVKWYNGLAKSILSLNTNPQRFGLAPESEYFDKEIRQLLYGKRGGVYRVLFTIEGKVVSILHARHSARDVFKPPDDE